MIRFSDAVVLAYTKLRTRKLRTLITILVASVIFGIMISFIFIIQGAIESSSRFNMNTLSKKYLASASYTRQLLQEDGLLPKNVLDRAKIIYKKNIADKAAAAKKLGIEYDSTIEVKPTQISNEKESLDSSSPSAAQALGEYISTLPKTKQLLDDTIKPYDAVKSFNVTAYNMQNNQIKMIKNSNEKFIDEATVPVDPENPIINNPDINQGWSYMDESIVKSFMLTSDQLKTQTDVNSIPVIAPVSKVEEALGLKKLSNTATSTEKLNRIKFIRDNAEKARFTVCYRNDVSQSQIKAAIDNAKEIKSNKDYKAPPLTYALPKDTGSCAPASISKDTRNADDKNLAKKQDEFNKMFGQKIEPVQQKITFRVVGLTPEGMGSSSLSDIGNLIALITSTSVGAQWIVPQQMFDAMPNKNDLNMVIPTDESKNYFLDDNSRQIVEFSNINDLKKFVTKVGCGYEFCTGEKTASYFGNNSVLMGQIKEQVTKFLSYAAIAVTIIASFIMMSMIGRVIGDSRRETAVFRAIGARRNDIRLIYLIYTTMLSIIILVVSMAIGILLALWMNSDTSPDATVQAHLIYIFSDDSMRFSFVGIWWEALLTLGALIIAAGFIGMLLPLSRNLARNPIKDMRDDT